jgi:hypothetical protein
MFVTASVAPSSHRIMRPTAVTGPPGLEQPRVPALTSSRASPRSGTGSGR